MINWIQGFGEFVIGLLALLLVIVIFLGGLVEAYDRHKEKNQTADVTKARLKSIQDGES